MKQGMNIYGIAKEAGVSPATVSRVITSSAKVSDDKRRRVEEIIHKYDYRPNALAQGLTTGTRVIGIVAADIENPYYGKLITQCQREIDAQGYSPMICGTMNRFDLEKKYLQKMLDMRTDAIVLMGGGSDALVTSPDYAELINKLSGTLPVITTGKVDGARCYHVGIDEMDGVDLAMEHLFSLGHRHIAMVGGRSDIKSTYDKRMRYRMNLSSRGITYRERYVIDAGYDIETGYQAGKKLVETNRGRTMPTAVMAINDFCAVGVMHAIQEYGLRMPEDMAMLSYDNTYICEAVRPRLTGIGYGYEKLGKTIVQTALALIEGNGAPAVQSVSPSLYVRESTGVVA